MAGNKDQNNSLSGISVGIGILATGFILAFWFKDALGPFTFWTALSCLFIGAVGSIIELTRTVNTKKLGWDNLGIGIVLLVPSYLLLSSSDTWVNWIKYPLNVASIILLLLAISAISDGIYKTGKAVSFKKINYLVILKTLGLFVSLIGSIIGLLIQLEIIKI